MLNHGRKKDDDDFDEYTSLLRSLYSTGFNYEVLKELVIKVPDDYFAWSTLKVFLEKNPEDLNLHSQINIKALTTNPKSYAAWNYRLFLFEKGLDLKVEDALTKELLNLDKRNFHCWNYRRKILINYSALKMNNTDSALKMSTTDSALNDYFNYSALNDLITENIKIENIIWTDPFYEGGFYLSFYEPYTKYLKIYKNKVFLCFKNPFQGTVTIDSKEFNIKYPVLQIELEREPINYKIGLKGEPINDNKVLELNPELMELEPNCVFLLLIQLKGIEKEREMIIDTLKSIDKMRINYYDFLKENYYRIVPLD